MEVWLRMVILSVLLVVVGRAVDPSCECLMFSNTFGKETGRFTSPDYPKPYPSGINCLLYTFIAGSDEIIELVFTDFHVYQAANDCSRGDWLKVFSDLDKPEVNEQTPWTGVLCGISQPVLYSSGSVLILEFHTDVKASNSSGFQGTFKFIDSSKYKTDGHRMPGMPCEYQFISSNLPPRGRFYSPQFPSSYPRNSRCIYRFKSEPKERIKLVFEDLRFQTGDVSCLDREDVLKVHDGPTALAPVIAVLCNQMTSVDVRSTSNQLFLEFVSSSMWPGHGFTASYQFESIEEPKGDILAKMTDSGPAVSATRSSCDVKVSSDSLKKGQIFSPGFPVRYLPSSRCRYEFTASGKERIKILFTYFKLYTKGKVAAKECNGEDSVTPYVVVEGRMEKLESFCGSTTPKPVMSNGPRLVLEFNSFNSSKGSGGFRAEYFFVKDFGLTTGKQLSEYPCAFRFTAEDSVFGTFHSPNYPGLYPRDTECHYFFHGTRFQHVVIRFLFFDVEGIHPCDTATASDYVEFFNFMDESKMYSRHCGQLEQFDVLMERRFFRITFRSNERLDGHGFNATYTYVDYPTLLRQPSPPMSASSSSKLFGQWIVIFALGILN